MISNIESAISDIRNGKLIIVVDDEMRVISFVLQKQLPRM